MNASLAASRDPIAEYLNRVASGLKGMSESQRQEIVAESQIDLPTHALECGHCALEQLGRFALRCMARRGGSAPPRLGLDGADATVSNSPVPRHIAVDRRTRRGNPTRVIARSRDRVWRLRRAALRRAW